VHRVVVQQSRGVEESFILFLNYARRLVEEEKYRRYSLGIPGLLLASYIVLNMIVPGFVWQVLLLILGLALLLKGFSLDTLILESYRASPLVFTSIMASALLVILSIITGVNYIASLGALEGAEAVGYFLLANLGGQILTLDLLVLSIVLPLTTRMLDSLFVGKSVSFGDYGMILFLVLFRQILFEYSKILVGGGSIFSLLYWMAITIVITAFIVALFTLVSKRTEKEATKGGGEGE